MSAGSRERAEEVAKKIEANGTKASVCQADVTRLEEIPKLIEAALKLSTTGKIEILIHKSGCSFVYVGLTVKLTPLQCRSR